MKLLVVRLHFVISLLNLTFGFKGCPNLTLNYKEFPKFKSYKEFSIKMFQTVDVAIKSPFYIEDELQNNFETKVNNLYFIITPYNENNTHQTMFVRQVCEKWLPNNLNYMMYMQNPKDNRLTIVYDNSEGDVFCQSKHEMSEIYLIDLVINDTKSEMSLNIVN